MVYLLVKNIYVYNIEKGDLKRIVLFYFKLLINVIYYNFKKNVNKIGLKKKN